MKSKSILVLLFFVTLSAGAQSFFPHNATEDTTGVMSKAYWDIWNPEIQAQIDSDIEKYRKADGTVKIDGVKKGTEVTVEQVSSDFKFGAHIFNFDQLGKKEYNDKYKDLYGTLFNSATVAFYWRTFETQPGRLRFNEEYWDTEDYWNELSDPKHQTHWRRPSTDKVVEYCKSRGVRVHGHPLIWGNRKWHNPQWLISLIKNPTEKALMDSMILEFGDVSNYKDCETYSDQYYKMSPKELEAMFPEYTHILDSAFKARIVNIAKHYGDKVDSWDVVNESADDYGKGNLIPGDMLCKSTAGFMPGDYPYKAFKTATEAFPSSVKLNINDYLLTKAYVDETNDIISRGARIDIMGSQMHLFNPKQCLDIANGAEIQTPNHIYGWYETLSKVGLPIHLSEITITSPGNDEKGRQIQAVITRNLYRLWFSLPNMMGITWWNVVDDCGAPGETSVSGLFTRDMQAKTSYYALQELILNEWRTNLTVKAAANGTISFRGFKGVYKITWPDESGQSHSIEYILK